MWEDPIVAEVHRTREKLAADCKFDVGAFFMDIRKRQASLGSRLIVQKEKAEPHVEAERGQDSNSPRASPSGTSPAA